MIQPMYNGSAQMATLPYEKQLIIEANIPLFEFEKRSMARLDNNDMGYVNCKAYKNDNSSRLAIGVVWYTGQNAYVRYSRDQNKRYVGYCPDDPEWFNRTRLCSTIRSNKFKIAKYINENGLITVGSEITEEINFIGTMLHDWVAKIDGAVVIRSKNEMEVKEYVNKKRTEGIAIQGPVWCLIEKIERIREHHRHDWIFSPEFQQEIIPEMKKRIKHKFNREVKEFKDNQPELDTIVSKMFPDYIKSMPLKELVKIVKKKKEEMCKGDIIDEDGNLFSDGIPLEKLKLNKIRSIAVKEFDIATEGKTRDELISLINHNIKIGTSNDINDIVGPPSPEEIKNREMAGLPKLETIENIQ
jgi:hypothetical protein